MTTPLARFTLRLLDGHLFTPHHGDLAQPHIVKLPVLKVRCACTSQGHKLECQLSLHSIPTSFPTNTTNKCCCQHMLQSNPQQIMLVDVAFGHGPCVGLLAHLKLTHAPWLPPVVISSRERKKSKFGPKGLKSMALRAKFSLLLFSIRLNHVRKAANIKWTHPVEL